MEGLGVAANVITVVELSAKVVSLCLEYSRRVKNAAKDIDRLLSELKSLQDVLEKVRQLMDGPNSSRLAISQGLRMGLDTSISELEMLNQQLEPSTGRKRMSRFGLRALKWPFKSEEVEKIIRRLDRCKQSIALGLQLDETWAIMEGFLSQKTDEIDIRTLTLNIDRKIDLAKLHYAEGAEFDSYADELDARCHPNTRVELRHQIKQWAGDLQGKCIFWLCGIAGTGKSTISRTMAQSFADES
jgi:Fungal N-terminal domain of STAND proteins